MSEVWRYKEYAVIDIAEPVVIYLTLHRGAVTGAYQSRDNAINASIDHMFNVFAEVLKPFAMLSPSRPAHYKDEFPVFAINGNNITFADIIRAKSTYDELSTGE